MTRNPYVVDPAFHTEGLFDNMFKKKTKKATPVVQERVGRKPYFDEIKEEDMKRESEGKQKHYSHDGTEATVLLSRR